MVLSTTAIISLIPHSVHAADCCSIAPGVANAECVKSYGQDGCDSAFGEGSFKPTCAGNRFVAGYKRVWVQGDGTYGVNCDAYSDLNCENYVSQAANTKSVGGEGLAWIRRALAV